MSSCYTHGLRKIENEQASNPRSFGRFVIRNIKANVEYSYATPSDDKVNTIDGQLLHSAPDRKQDIHLMNISSVPSNVW